MSGNSAEISCGQEKTSGPPGAGDVEEKGKLIIIIQIREDITCESVD